MSGRRKFIQETGTVTAAICCGAGLFTVLDSCTPIKYLQATKADTRLTISVAEFAESKFAIINEKTLPAPIYLNRNEDNSYNALLMLCTHKQCELRPTGFFLSCPCHGSQFSNKGKVLKPPADEPLKKLDVITDNTSIHIILT